jgi:hypothetical protein
MLAGADLLDMASDPELTVAERALLLSSAAEQGDSRAGLELKAIVEELVDTATDDDVPAVVLSLRALWRLGVKVPAELAERAAAVTGGKFG